MLYFYLSIKLIKFNKEKHIWSGWKFHDKSKFNADFISVQSTTFIIFWSLELNFGKNATVQLFIGGKISSNIIYEELS